MNLDTPAFKEAWDKWSEHRKEIRKPLTQKSVNEQIKMLSQMRTTDEAIETVELAIRNGWQGLFPPKKDAKQQSKISPGVKYDPSFDYEEAAKGF